MGFKEKQMKLQLDNQHSAVIKFFHRTIEREDSMVEFHKGTGCLLEIYSNEAPLPFIKSEAVSLLHPKDVYSKAKGRKVALHKAMSLANVDKELRTKIWEALFNTGIKR